MKLQTSATNHSQLSDMYNIMFVQDQVVKQTTTEKEMEVDDNKPSVSCEEDDTSYEELFAAVVTAKDGERCISEMFKLLPSKKVHDTEI